MSPLSEDGLFDLFRRTGDPAALAEVFDRTAPDLLRVAQHMCGSVTAAEDLVQATFVAAIEHARDWDPSRPLMPWLVTILTNKARLLRRQDARPIDPQRLRAEQPVDAEQQARSHELSGAVDEAIRTLPDVYQSVLVLWLRHGLSPAEIADALRRPAGTVRSQLLRGLELLRKSLPAGFAVGALALIATGRGLAAVRALVLARAGSVASGTAAGLAAPLALTTVLGTLAMKKSLLAVVPAVLALAATAGWFAFGPAPAASSRASGVVELPAVAPVASHETAPLTTQPVARQPAASAPASPALARAVVRVTFAVDGSPAAGHVVKLRSYGVSNGELSEHEADTDGRGVAAFDAVAPGSASVASVRAGWKAIKLSAGTTTQAELAIGAGPDVTFVVVDSRAHPIAGAGVWLSDEQSRDAGAIVGTTGTDGRLALRSVTPGRWASAFARGYMPCNVVPVRGDAKGSEPIEVRVVLQGPAGEVAGRVLDLAGTPVPGATVLVGLAGDPNIRVGGQELTAPPPNRKRTDGAGRFHAIGVPASDSLPVYARAPGFVRWSGTAKVSADRVTEIEIRLRRGFTVEGRVTDAAGQPVAGVSVAHHVAHGQDDGMSGTWASSAEDGTFRLLGLTPGPVTLHASGREGGAATLTTDGVEGAVVRWDPVLGAGPRITGRVVDEAGAPLAGWFIETTTQKGSSRSARTRTDGGFTVTDCEDVEQKVAAYDPGDKVHPAATVAARPGTDPLTIRVPADRRATARISGTIVDADGKPVTGTTAYAWRIPPDCAARIDVAADGRFTTGPQQPGRYQVELNAPGHPQHKLEPVEIARDQQLELGEIRLPACGRLVANLRHDDGTPVEKGSLHIVDQRQPQYAGPSCAVQGSAIRSGFLLPGDYIVRSSHGPIALFEQPFTIEPGKETRLDLTVRRGLTREVRLVGGTEHTGKDVRVDLRWRDVRGTVVCEETYVYEGLDDVRLYHSFAPGTWTLEARAATGHRAQATFTVEASATAAPPVEVRWRDE